MASENARSPPKRRLTPTDDPDILIRWRDLERHYVVEVGLSHHQAHLKIAEEYQTSRTAVRQWLLYGVGRHPRREPTSYAEQMKSPSTLKKKAFQKRFAREPGKFIIPCYQSLDEAISLEELSLRLKSRFEYLPSLKTLERIAQQGHPKTKAPILEKALENPTVYRLARDS